MLNPPSEIRQVMGLTPEQITRIRDFMQGAIYSWVKNRPDEWFAVHDLVGGENTEWRETPLMVLYDKHTASKPHEQAFDAAAKDLGWLMKALLHDDRREFETRHDGFANTYHWTRRER